MHLQDFAHNGFNTCSEKQTIQFQNVPGIIYNYEKQEKIMDPVTVTPMMNNKGPRNNER